MDKNQLLLLLERALKDPSRRSDSVRQFQEAIFNGDQSGLHITQTEWVVFCDLAYDLDYYEPDPKTRREDPSFCGDDRVVSEIAEALGKLHDHEHRDTYGGSLSDLRRGLE
jgi:hypothetical protein